MIELPHLSVQVSLEHCAPPYALILLRETDLSAADQQILRDVCSTRPVPLVRVHTEVGLWIFVVRAESLPDGRHYRLLSACPALKPNQTSDPTQTHH
ncbi:hypothetical protein [Deinococcus sonorensis]|uniref:Uncharacterized protein n=2 Tax=Deinococcus sonorensis TaxID=309891 RepID=A0AAU7UBH8_9DEIO